MFDNMAFWLWPDSIKQDDPVESATRMAAAGATHVFPFLLDPEAEDNGKDEKQKRLAELIEACKRSGLQVHGCLCANGTAGQPDAYQRREDGSVAEVVCHANPVVSDWILARLNSFLNRYPLDGITLEDDFIYQTTAKYDPANASESDYTTIGSCFCDHCKEHAPPDPEARAAYKEAALTELVGRIAATCKKRGNLPLSAAARLPYGRDFYTPWKEEIPYWDGWGHCQSKAHFSADWAAWYRLGLLDFVCPMSYLHNTRIVEWQTEEARSLIDQPEENVWMGLGLMYVNADWSEKRSPEYLNDGPKIREQLEMLQRFGQKNVVFFAYQKDWLTDELIKVMAETRGAGCA